MVAGLEMPSSGRIEIGGRNVTYLRPRYRNVGMVFQDYGLYRHMTVFGNIAYPLQVRGLGKTEIRDKVGAVAKTMQIGDILAASRTNSRPGSFNAWRLPGCWCAMRTSS